MSTVTAKQERITPQKAERYLSSNPHNRPLRDATVRRLAAAIKRGEWRNNGETIKFNGDGKLLDGQHRLAAIVKADEAVDALVARGLALEAQETIDTGVRRNPADVLELRGFVHGAATAAACKAAHFQSRLGNLVNRQDEYPTHQQIIEIAESDPDTVQEVAAFAVKYREDHRELGLSAPMLAELIYASTLKTSYEQAIGFWAAVANNESGAPAVFRRSMIENRVSKGNMSRNVRLAFAVKAFNAWVTGRDMKRLRWKRTNPGRETFPAITDEVA